MADVKRKHERQQTLTLGEIRSAIPALNALGNKEDIPIRRSFELSRTIDRLQEEARRCEETRQDLLKQYARTDGDGNVLTDEQGQAIFEDGRRTAFEREYRDLLDHEVEVVVTTFTLDELEEWGVGVTANDLVAIPFLIQEHTDA